MSSSGPTFARRALLAGSAALTVGGGATSARARPPARCLDEDAAWIPSDDLVQELPRFMRIAGVPGVAIAVMGCIVNGPGEMADADFGYVGGAPNKINLYVNKTPVKFNIPEAEAVDQLIDLIKEHDKWIDAPTLVAEV